MRLLRGLGIAAGVLVLGGIGGADVFEGGIALEEPDFTRSASVLTPGRLQLEMGFGFAYGGGKPSSRSWGLPEALLRVGVVDGLELQFGAPSWESMREGGDRQEGATDAAIGAKLRLLEQDGWMPDFAAIGFITLPTAKDGLGANSVEGGGGVAVSYDFAHGIEFDADVLVSSQRVERENFTEFELTLSASFPIVEGLSLIAEYAGQYRSGGGGGPEHILGPGLSYDITERIVLDCVVGFGLNDRSDDVVVGVLLSILF